MMAQDVSVNSVDILKGYNSRIKTFNSSVNTLIYMFRRKVEGIISDCKSQLGQHERDYDKACREIDAKINNWESSLNSYICNWDDASAAKIQNEIQRLQMFRARIDAQMQAVRQDYSNLTLKLDQIIQTSATFGVSNQNLLDSNVLRMDNIIQYIDRYKSDSVK